MKITRYLLQLVLIALIFPACDDEENDNVGKGESINSFKLVSPSNFSEITLNPGTPDMPVAISWEAAKTGKGSTPTYRFMLDEATGDFSDPVISMLADNEGKDAKATLTVEQLINAATSAGTSAFKWTVEARTDDELGANAVKASNAFELTIQVSDVGISAFEYLSPSVNEKILLDKIRTPNEEILISWTAAVSDEGAVKYKWIAATTPDGFDDPVLELDSDEDGAATTLTLTHAELTDLLADVSYTDGLYWRVEATAGDFSYAPDTRFMWFEIFNVETLYIVGSLTNDWENSCETAIPLTKKSNGLFESLVNIPAGAEFKLVLTCGSWNVNWGGSGGTAEVSTDYDLVSPGSNIKVQDAGSYFVKADFATGKFRITPFTPPANLYLVGGATSANWNPSAAIPFVDTGTNTFEIFAHIKSTDGFKFLQVKDWAGDWGKGDEGKLVQEGESDLRVSTEGFYRITTNFSTLSYSVEQMNFGIVGSARTGDDSGWGADDDMEFVGGDDGYKWSKVITLFNGKIKFRANDDWAVNFGDTGADGTLEYAGSDINITAGTYLIEMTLDPVNGYKYTITPQ
jgi:hypothetical protein